MSSQHLQVLREATTTSKRQKSKRSVGAASSHHGNNRGSRGSGAAANGTASSLTTGSSSSAERLRESDTLSYRQGQVASISIAAAHLSSTTALPHRRSIRENCISPGPIQGFCQRLPCYASHYPEQNNRSLPSLSGMLGGDGQPPPGLPLAHGSLPIAMGSLFVYQAGVEYNGGYHLLKSHSECDSLLPSIRALPSSNESDLSYAKPPMRGVSGAGSENAVVEPSHWLPNYSKSNPIPSPHPYTFLAYGSLGYLSNSSSLRHRKNEQTGDGDAVLTTAERLSTSAVGNFAGRFDGISALLHAGKLLAVAIVAEE